MARVFAVMVQAVWLIRVSRYNVDRMQVVSQGIVILLTAAERSAYTIN
jgi:hypothetical protein